jgi:hypothetical protein
LAITTDYNDIIIFTDGEQHQLTLATSTFTGIFPTFTLPAGTYNIFIMPLCNDNTGDGMLLQTNAANDRFTGFITDSGGYIPPVPPVPHIESLTYATSTAMATITGYWEATTTPYITQRLSFWQYSDALGRESYNQITATTTGYFNYSFSFLDPYAWQASTTATTTAPIYNSFTLNASLDQYNDTNYVFGQLPPPDYIINIDATSTIVSASFYNAIDFTATARQLALYPEYECSITSLTGCFKNALIWIFYPTQDVLDNWNGLLGLIQTKAPVGYFFMARDSINGLSATSTKAFNVVIPTTLKTYIFTPFDDGIAAILWFFFIFNFYKRLKHITV